MEIRTNVTEEGNVYGYWQIAPDTWCITDRWKNFIYLLIGEAKAMLIDSCCGEGNVRNVVEEITSKPVMVVNTHGHFDHTGGNSCWQQAWMTKEAALYAKEPFGPKYREWFSEKPYPDYTVGFLRDGDQIELGERMIEIISIPTHSEGSVALLDSRTRFLFCGDEVESGQVIWFVRNSAIPLEEMAFIHKQNMEKLLERRIEYDLIWPAHNGAPLFPDQYLRDFIALDEEIMAGKQNIQKDTAGFGFPADTQAVPNLFMQYGELIRTNHGLASIVYAKSNSVYHNEERKGDK